MLIQSKNAKIMPFHPLIHVYDDYTII